jgi:hypothetical protein
MAITGGDSCAADAIALDPQTTVEWPAFLDQCGESTTTTTTPPHLNLHGMIIAGGASEPRLPGRLAAGRRINNPMWLVESTTPMPQPPGLAQPGAHPLGYLTMDTPGEPPSHRVDGFTYFSQSSHQRSPRTGSACRTVANPSYENASCAYLNFSTEAAAFPVSGQSRTDSVFYELSSILMPTAASLGASTAASLSASAAAATTTRRARNTTAPSTSPPAARVLTKSSEGIAARKPAEGKQRRHYRQARSSKYCHLCARHERIVEMVSCGNLSTGLCQKSVCRKCFSSYGLDWEAARMCALHLWQNNPSFDQRGGTEVVVADGGRQCNSSGSPDELWLCPHCLNTCPSRAKCYAYNRQTVQRRARTQQARMLEGSENALGL